MITQYTPLLFFLIQIVCLFFVSRFTINEMFYFLRIFLKKETNIFVIISIIFFPGTVIHELAHFLVASVLFLRVRNLSIFPKFEGTYIKLGSILYEKKDALRGILVGVAPILVGVLIFFLVNSAKLFPTSNLYLNIVMLYLIFTVSSTMFSSKQDLVDLIFIIPLVIVIGGAIYIFNIKTDVLFKNKLFLEGLLGFANKTNLYLLISLLINLGLITILRSTRLILKR